MKNLLILFILFIQVINVFGEDVITKNYYTGTFVVNGDKDKYYPVVFQYSDANRINHIKVSRSYQEAGPIELSPTHKGGLTLELDVNYGSWGGATVDWRVMDLRQAYHETFGGAMFTMHNYAFIIFLRGGGFVYHYECEHPANLIIADVNNTNIQLYDHSNDEYDVYAPNPLDQPNLDLINAHKNDHWNYLKGKPFDSRGYLGILKSNPEYPIDVEGTMRATEIKVEAQTADFVFEDDYQLKSLTEVEQFIQTNNHLPDIPSAKQMEKDGVGLAEMNKLLLQKVEELTIYLIDQQKQLELQNNLINQLLDNQTVK